MEDEHEPDCGCGLCEEKTEVPASLLEKHFPNEARRTGEVEMLERFEEIFRRKIFPEEREKLLRMSDEELLREYGTLFGPVAIRVLSRGLVLRKLC